MAAEYDLGRVVRVHREHTPAFVAAAVAGAAAFAAAIIAASGGAARAGAVVSGRYDEAGAGIGAPFPTPGTRIRSPRFWTTAAVSSFAPKRRFRQGHR